jgi:hypothetical protein
LFGPSFMRRKTAVESKTFAPWLGMKKQLLRGCNVRESQRDEVTPNT